MNTIGTKIRLVRERRDMSQEELGKLCDTTKQTIFKYESGIVTNIPLDRLLKIAAALDVSVSDLIGESKPVNKGHWTGRFREGVQYQLAVMCRADAEAACIDIQKLERIASGVEAFSFEDACEIADSLGVSLDSLVRWDDAHEIST